jgi:hypothetical protein
MLEAKKSSAQHSANRRDAIDHAHAGGNVDSSRLGDSRDT